MSASAASLEITVSGPPQTVFDWSSMRCETWDVPDVPARAWRGADGNIHLLASHFRNRVMSGPDFDSLRQDCAVVFEGGGRDAPALHDDRGWIGSTYTGDGETVFALVHNEFQGHRRPALCPAARYMACWRNSLTMALSRDGGHSFRQEPPPRHYVAGLPYPYGGAAGKPTGYFNPSNMIEKDGYYYAFFWAEDFRAQRRGACLMRTRDFADRTSWRAWDGAAFSIAFIDPSAGEPRDPQHHVCTPLAPSRLTGFVASVVRHRPSGLYLALMATVRSSRPDGEQVAGIYAATSPDLLVWSSPILVAALPMQFRYACSDGAAFFYPSLLDPDSPSRNFEDTDDRANLYLTKIYLDECQLGARRDLVRVPLIIAVRH